MLEVIQTDLFKDLKNVTSDKTVVGGEFDTNGLFSPEIFGSNIPQCQCGALTGSFYVGELCTMCNTHVSDENNYSGAKIPLYTEDTPFKLINPATVRFFKYYGVNFLEMTNPQNKVVSLEGDFVFDESKYISFDSLLNDYENSLLLLKRVFVLPEDFVQHYLDNPDEFFIDDLYVLPLSLREAQISKNMGEINVKMNEINSFYVQLINMVNNIKEFSEVDTGETIENELNQLQRVYDELNVYIIDSVLKGKDGILRDGILSNRVNFSGRAPIVLLDDSEHPMDIHIPREMFLEIYKLKVVRVLSEQMNLDLITAERYLRLNMFNEEDSIINDIIKDIINNEELIGVINRNPSLSHNNILACRVTNVHEEMVFKISKLNLPSLDGDVDGDTVAFFTLDTLEARESAKKYYSLASLVTSPYNKGEIDRKLLSPYQDNNIGFWLMNEENFNHIKNC